MLLNVRETPYADPVPMQIPLWHIKLLMPADGAKGEGLYQFKIGDSWQWYWVDTKTADEISGAIQETERRMKDGTSCK